MSGAHFRQTLQKYQRATAERDRLGKILATRYGFTRQSMDVMRQVFNRSGTSGIASPACSDRRGTQSAACQRNARAKRDALLMAWTNEQHVELGPSGCAAVPRIYACVDMAALMS